MAAAVRRGSLRRPQEDQTLPKIAVAPDGDLIAGYRVAVVITAAVGGIVVVGERDRCDQTIPGNRRDPHADLCEDCLITDQIYERLLSSPDISFSSLSH